MLTTQAIDSSDHVLLSAVRQLFREYAKELNIDLCFQGFEGELENLPGKYAPPEGTLLVVLDGNIPVACGALRPMEALTCELKRIYVRPTHRGLGIGRDITVDLLAAAQRLGYVTVRLDTLHRLKPALALYESLGFKEIQPYNFNPELDVAYFEKSLRALS